MLVHLERKNPYKNDQALKVPLVEGTSPRPESEMASLSANANALNAASALWFLDDQKTHR